MVVREVAVEVDTRCPRIRTFSPNPGEELPASRVVIHGEVDELIAEVQSEPKATDLVIKDRSFVATVPVEGLFPVVRFKVVDQVGHASPEQQIKLYNPTWIPAGLEPRGDKVYSLKDQSYMVRVPGAQFIVRDDRGRPRHCKVHPFFADVTEVTNAQYRRFLEWARNASNPRQFSHPSEPMNKDHTPAFWDGSGRAPDDVPVVGVDWWDAYAYAGWAGKSLFHDVTWVVTARGVPESLYPWGDALPRRTYANYLGDPAGGPVPVLKYEQGRSPFGCYEMAGNVMEWCLDENPDSDCRLAQGGSWFHSPRFLRMGHGVYYPPSLRTKFLGFRCARYLTYEPEQKTDAPE
jgi:formylglycine-generating enzyme required for sulfatase activity